MSTRLSGAKYKSVFDRGRPFRGRPVAAWVLLRGKRTADVMDELRYVARKGGFLLKTEEPV